MLDSSSTTNCIEYLIEEKRQLESATEEVLDSSSTTNWIEYLKTNFANAFSWLGVQTMFVFIIAFITQKINIKPEGISQAEIEEIDKVTGQMISISFLILNAVGALLPKFVLLPIAKKIGRVKTQMVSVAVMSLAYFGMAFFVRSSEMLYLFMALAGIGWAAIVSLPFAIMSETVNKAKMGFFMGMFNLSIVIPQLIVSTFFGKVIENSLDKNIVFLISGISLAISAVLWLTVKEQKA